MFEILTDTSANLSFDMLQKRGIGCIPLTFLVDGQEQMCLSDTFDGERYYDAIRGGAKVTTSQITPQRCIDVMRPLLEQGRDVLYVGMSSGISGSFSSAQMAAAELRAAFPGRQIALVDTLSASLGEGLLALYAADLRDRGVSLAETAAALERRKYRMCQVFSVDDLKYLRATGRLSAVKTVIASVLQLKPLLKGDREGKIVCFAKVRGKSAVVPALAREYERAVRDAGHQTIGIAHAGCAAEAEQLAALLRQSKPPKDILTVCYEPVTGAHVGPGALALFFLGEESFRG